VENLEGTATMTDFLGRQRRPIDDEERAMLMAHASSQHVYDPACPACRTYRTPDGVSLLGDYSAPEGGLPTAPPGDIGTHQGAIKPDIPTFKWRRRP
jgi:hypothetical protein